MNPTAPKHQFVNPFNIEDTELVIGGLKLSRLAQRVGQTPFYAYDRQLLNARIAELRQNMPPELKIHYAMKANPMPAIVQHMATIVDGFDLASAGEMKVALDTVMPATQISMAGPGKRPAELGQAIAAGITINVESQQELNVIAALSEQTGIQANVALRINPAFELKASGMKMGGGPKQFGIDEELIPTVLQHIKSLDLHFKGFHIYSGSQNLKAESIIDAQQKSIQLAVSLTEHCPSPIEKLNIGGGFGIPYFPGDVPLDTRPIGDALAEAINQSKSQLPEAEIIIELGRYLVGEAGIYASQVIDKKISRGQIYLIVDGGLHHHLAASGNFGQVIRKNYPVAIGNKMGIEEMETVNIVGPLCTPLDILADKVPLPKAEIGDYVVIFQSGAYGLTASPTAFLTQPNAEEILV
ncbi:pyridoxal-dependent decarboxylase, exosortase A system-associated [Methylotuvimicrobium alcaliphilum]|uniref:Ornithine/diaminopimelate PLP-dependent decarboxylase n=1 Tax=Methylotuvimicrobium alcaliphilum (strain DSM 19304 / NCIMB 14124 / VKM B-2133 / 20Z) TaxID=1091494 RepID=G4SYT5_META2|nr:pyridoxal-dependent decarboxylase, exosortase A system-associated [Methylotuvimicrobium alcaliphilum]CCE24382.1 putative ornithine/diaminopimelate PLP-dependent decarboxylase [Methylotuvimicrobium alcaliphilum 20Z]